MAVLKGRLKMWYGRCGEQWRGMWLRGGIYGFLGIWRDVGGYLLNLQIEIQQSLRFGDVLDVYYGYI